MYDGDNFVDESLLVPIESLDAEQDEPRVLQPLEDDIEDVDMLDPTQVVEVPRRVQRRTRGDRMLDLMERAVDSIEQTAKNFERLTDAVIKSLKKQ